MEFLALDGGAPVATIQMPRGTLLTEPSVEGDFSAALPSPATLPPGKCLVRAILDIGTTQDIGAEQELTITRTTTPNGSGR